MNIKLQLIHAATDTTLWAQEYEEDTRDVLRLQGDVARAVADQIRVQVTAEESARMAATVAVAPEAHDAYLIGRYHLWKYNEHDLAQAILHFTRALELDPKYAAAYAGLSHAWWARGIFGASNFKDVQGPARIAASNALVLDAALADAQVAQGRIKYSYDWDWAAAEKHFKHALDIDPNNLDARYFSAMLLMGMGRFDESFTHIERAARLDPLSSTVQSGYGRILYRARRFDEAIERLNQAIALEPRNPGSYGRLADVYEAMGKYSEALTALERAAAVHGGEGGPRRRARVYARMGRQAEARQMLGSLEPGSPELPFVDAAAIAAALGDTDEAFAFLFRLVDERSAADMPVFINQDPPFDGLRTDPRWKTLAKRLKFAQTAP